MIAVALALLLLATYFDLKYRIIPDWLTKSLIIFGTLFHLLSGNVFVLAYVFGTFLFAYILYHIGLWAGGDVKLFTAFSAVFPYSVAYFGVCLPAFLWLFLFALLATLVITVPYLIFSVLRDPHLRNEFVSALRFVVLRLLAFLIVAHIFGVFAFLFLLLPSQVLYLSALAVFLSFPSAEPFFQFLFVFPVSILFILLPYRLVVFVREKDVSELREGDVPADFVMDDGTVVPFTWKNAVLSLVGEISPRLSPLRAAGLEQSDIEWLKRSGPKRIRVKDSLPFVPFVFAAYVFMLVLGISYCG